MLGRIVTVAALAAGGVLLSKKLKKSAAPGGPSSIEVSTEVDVPVGTAYNQWTQFEEFPRFMHSVHEVRQLDDEHLHWKASVAGKQKEWDAEITEQLPDQRIAWRSTDGPLNEGTVSFEKLSESRTRIMLRMTYGPESLGEKLGDALGAVKLEARRNLRNFKDLIEGRGVETGAWRGTVTH
ncbi:MAG: SRPBCC family protein [Comamonadaceae bacterium]|nr:MAG: SRPBCC family protein [Comamonadaceae bacterium]